MRLQVMDSVATSVDRFPLPIKYQRYPASKVSNKGMVLFAWSRFSNVGWEAALDSARTTSRWSTLSH